MPNAVYYHVFRARKQFPGARMLQYFRFADGSFVDVFVAAEHTHQELYSIILTVTEIAQFPSLRSRGGRG